MSRPSFRTNRTRLVPPARRAYGDDHNEETRAAVQEQIRLGESLRRKQLRPEESGESSAEDMDVDQEIADNAAPLPKVTGVMGMGFMQRNLEKQRKEAGKLLADLKRMEEGRLSGESSDDEPAAPKQSAKKKLKGSNGAGGAGLEVLGADNFAVAPPPPPLVLSGRAASLTPY